MALSREEFADHLQYVSTTFPLDEHGLSLEQVDEVRHAPIFSSYVMNHVAQNMFTQYGLLGRISSHHLGGFEIRHRNAPDVNLLYANHVEPSSTFIVGSQGSGKSHTLAAHIENCVIQGAPTNQLPHPLPVIAFHYDPYTSHTSVQYSELAYLCSAGVKVRVLVASSNLHSMKRLYENLPGLHADSPRPVVLPLRLRDEHLSIGNMMTLMNVKEDGKTPLYLSVVWDILRDMAEKHPHRPGIDYDEFRQRLRRQGFSVIQNQMLALRLRMLESFLEKKSAKHVQHMQNREEDIWNFEAGTVTIIDLSSPFINSSDACAFFTICLNQFMSDRAQNSRVVALDEAHKFLDQSGEATKLTESLISIIRQQRHLGTRVMIATQEPTLDPRLLDLCNVVFVHRFNSPAWFAVLQKHLAGSRAVGMKTDELNEIFRTIVSLPTGTALMFSPTSVVFIDQIATEHASHGLAPVRLKDEYLKVQIRKRLTVDGGRSLLASDRAVLPVEVIVIDDDSDEERLQSASPPPLDCDTQRRDLSPAKKRRRRPKPPRWPKMVKRRQIASTRSNPSQGPQDATKPSATQPQSAPQEEDTAHQYGSTIDTSTSNSTWSTDYKIALVDATYRLAYPSPRGGFTIDHKVVRDFVHKNLRLTEVGSKRGPLVKEANTIINAELARMNDRSLTSNIKQSST